MANRNLATNIPKHYLGFIINKCMPNTLEKALKCLFCLIEDNEGLVSYKPIKNGVFDVDKWCLYQSQLLECFNAIEKQIEKLLMIKWSTYIYNPKTIKNTIIDVNHEIEIICTIKNILTSYKKIGVYCELIKTTLKARLMVLESGVYNIHKLPQYLPGINMIEEDGCVGEWFLIEVQRQINIEMKNR
jgi:hypothetical protein